MELVHDFTVKAPIDQAWATLTDVERIAPCLPGAQLQEIDGDVYKGVVKVKVGPITAQFKGQATFVERDDESHKAVLKAEGRDTAGKGNASALITADLDAVDDESTKVSVRTDLTITGKVAQFGRGALADVSEKLLGQFVDNLETTVLHPEAMAAAAAPAEAVAAAEAPAVEAAAADAEAPAVEVAPPESAVMAVAPSAEVTATATPATAAPEVSPNGSGATTTRKVDHAEPEPIDLVGTAGVPVLKRLAPLIGIGLLLFVVVRWLRRR